MDLETRRKISQSMKGRSNFEGKRHTHATKIQIGISQEGHRNVKDHKWVTDKETGQERRVKGKLPKGMRWGRSPSSFNENFLDGRNPEDKGDMARHGLKNKTIAQLKKIRASSKATPRQKQLAHWYINMHKEEKEVWEKPNPVKNSSKLSTVMKARAKARAKAAGRPYPNMVDNIWAARNEGTDSAKRLEGTDSLRKIYTKDTPGQKKQQVDEAKATYCGRCGTTHVAPKFGGKCPALKEEQLVEQSSESLKRMSDYHAKEANYHDKHASNETHSQERRKNHALARSSHYSASENYLKASRADNDTERNHYIDKAERHADSAEEREREHRLMESTVPFEGPYTKTKENEKDKSGAVHTPMSRARHLARMAMKVKKLKDSQ